MPVPLPLNFVKGLDIQRNEFELGKWSYLHGVQHMGGWWYWYLYAVAVKEPLGLLVLALLAVAVQWPLWGVERKALRRLVLWAPAVTLFVFVSSQTGFSRYERYVLPTFPFVFLWVARFVKVALARGYALKWVTGILLCWATTSMLFIYPHCQSYFNELVGGPFGGPRHLLDANVDWGQDLLFLKAWCDSHPTQRPLFVQYFGYITPHSCGIDADPIPMLSRDRDTGSVRPHSQLRAGWFAISVNNLYGYKHFGDEAPVFSYLFDGQMVGSAGYSIYIIRLSEELVQRLNRGEEQQSLAGSHTETQAPDSQRKGTSRYPGGSRRAKAHL